MCGLAGILDFERSTSREVLRGSVESMAQAIAHRGPDDGGTFIDEAQGVALGFRRLSIIDTSAAGHQPMFSATGRYVIAFNGEVYNFNVLRADLQEAGATPLFRGHADTEVILAAVETWGIEAAVRRFIGMFAIALWDRERHILHLVRDRLGVKPLYYGFVGNKLLFGSEHKALAVHPDFSGEIDRDAVALFLRHSYVPAPETIYRGIFKMMPGTILDFHSGREGDPGSTTYWSAGEMAEAGVAAPFRGTEGQAVDRAEALLRDSVRLRMIADVPLGVFLSGGIDSSLITALMQEQSPGRIKTYSIGMDDSSFDEAPFARAMAAHLGTAHTEFRATPSEARDVIPQLPSIYDEPFADSSQIPTYMVSRLARQHVTVALSGDGGDEVFGGYVRYLAGAESWKWISRIPETLKPAVARILGLGSGARLSGPVDRLGAILPRRHRQSRLHEKLGKLARIVPSRSPDDLYERLIRQWPDGTVLGVSVLPPPLHSIPAAIRDPVQRMMYRDLVSYLPDDILVKVDRASMAVALETREPLLDHRLVEFAWTLPREMKIRHGEGKWILREILRRRVPPRLLDRPKAGFAIPVGNWLRGPLRPWAEELMDPSRLHRDGLLDVGIVQERWKEHLSGRRDWQDSIWAVLMLQAWMDRQKELAGRSIANAEASPALEARARP